MSGTSDLFQATATRVGVRVSAEFEQLTMLRALTETALLMAEMPLDEVTDIQVAVDEIATAVIDSAVLGSELKCEFGFHVGWVSVFITAVAGTRYPIDEQGLGWHVVRTITDSLSADVGSFDAVAGGYPVTVEFDRTGGYLGL
ncbi:anti-sigma factor [Nocardia alni]|uniref:anti-sigma factor n=1 Tax=Nocardia alni TaxID=2815723 RepID=UPI001C217B00|nr:anti-sigma factor [Nocardia alni]